MMSKKNSLDFLRLLAATLVLYSHQHALMGMPEPTFFGWESFGGAGVTIFFFLSGSLIWNSWERDSNLKRFFFRRSLRIFPALFIVVLSSIFILGPLLSYFKISDYFLSSETWHYLSNAILIPKTTLPGVFSNNPYPKAINGSLWTLPVEFLCYISVAILGSFKKISKPILIAANLLLTALVASLAQHFLGGKFLPHFEMISVFWTGVFYGYCIKHPFHTINSKWLILLLACISFFVIPMLGLKSFERIQMLAFAICLVHIALNVSIGAKFTDRIGDLSYGLYIFAFPVQQVVIHLQLGLNQSFSSLFTLSLIITSSLAFGSWHLIEKKALLFKPKMQSLL